jgi:pimeloyl-ACP methyl ester carboxylesterase
MPLAKVLHDAGYHVATFDMRNHGDSADDGRWRGQSPRYSIDFHRVVRYLMQRPDLAGAKIACVGFSMGAWTALEVARWEPETVRAVVCDSGPTLDIAATIRRMYAAGRSRLPAAHRGPILFWLGREAFTRASLLFLRPAPWPREFGDHSTEMLFIAGAADPVVRPEDVRDQLRWYPNADLWMVPRAGHTTALVVASQEYEQRVLALLEKAFGPPPAEAVGA